MKKLLTFALALCLCAGTVSCGKAESGEAENSSDTEIVSSEADTSATTMPETTTTTTKKSKTTLATKKSKTTLATKEPDNTATTTTKNTTTTTTTSIAVPQDIVLYDTNGIKITYKGLDNHDFWGSKIKLLIENNTDRSYTIQVRDFSANGFMIRGLISADVAAGKKINDGITIKSYDFEENNISSIENVEFTFHIFNWDDWDDSFDSDIIYLEF